MKTLKSTTALALCVALSIPHPVFAGEHGGMKACGDTPEPPCLLDSGIKLTKGESNGLESCPDPLLAEATPCLTPEGFTAVAGDEDVPAEEATAEEATEEAPVEAAVEVPAEEAPAEEATAEEAPEEAPVAATEEAPTEEATAKATEDAAPEDATAEVTGETPDEDATAAALREALEGKAGDAVAEEVAEDVIEEVAPVASAAAAASGEGEAVAEEAEVATEEVTEETARSSSEDFATAATGDVSATASASTGGESGLSNFEKALLVGLGAIAVGSILKSGDEVVSNSGDRVVLQDEDGDLRVLKDDDALLRQPGSQVRTETFSDGSTRTIVTRDDGTRIITIRAADGTVLRRVREFEDGSRVVLFDDTEISEPVIVSELPRPAKRLRAVDVTDEDALRRALAEEEAVRLERRFSLRQIRQIREVRELAPEIELDAVTFASGSAAIEPGQAEELASLGRAMQRIIDERPGEVFLIEGHTDAVGSATLNLALSDRRAETVALALTEYFGVPPENMITQGYGEAALKIDTDAAERLNRRAAVRRITPLLRQAVLDN